MLCTTLWYIFTVIENFLHFFKKVLTKQFLFVIITFAEREYLRKRAAMAQLVEHILGKDEVPSSNLGSSSKTPPLL